MADKSNYTNDVYTLRFDMQVDGIDRLYTESDIISITCINDFISNRFPFLMVTMVLNIDDYLKFRALYKHDKPIVKGVSLLLYSRLSSEEKSIGSPGNSNVTPEDDFDLFRAYHNMMGIPDAVDYISEAEIDKYQLKSDSETTGGTVADAKKKIRITLFNQDDLQAFNRGVSNFISRSADMNTLIMKLFKDCANPKLKIAPTPSHNTKTYEQVIEPLYNFYDGLKYLDDKYYIYKYPFNVFIKNNIVFLYPIIGDVNMELSLPKLNTSLHIELKDNYDVNKGEELSDVTDKGVYAFNISKDNIHMSPVYNNIVNNIISNTADGLLNFDNKDKLIHSIKTISTSGSPDKMKEMVKNKFIEMTFQKAPPNMELFPHSNIKIVHPEFGGNYRLGVFTETFTRDEIRKGISIFTNNQ